jgi:hypothetical protein
MNQVNGLSLKQTPLRLELILPPGHLWTQGEQNATDWIKEKVGEFCRVAVRRRHWKDMSLEIEGDEAKRFIEIVQTYASPPGPGRQPKKS